MPVTQDELFQRYDIAKLRKTNWDSMYQECYEYAIPNRDMLYYYTGGEDKAINIYDSTAPNSTVNFANTLHEALTPPEYRWFEFAPGTQTPPMMRERVQLLLDSVTERYFELLNSTNFDTEVNQFYQDLAAGTGSLAIRRYPGSDTPATFSAVPPFEILIAEGREGIIDTVIRCYKMDPRSVKITWPDASFNPDDYKGRPLANTADKRIEVLEFTFYDYDTKKWEYRVFLEKHRVEILQDSLLYNPWVVARWSVVSGEIYGRGPLVNALPDIKTANKTVEMVLQNASMSLAGVYTAVDDGVLNPANVELTPGVIIPVAYNQGPFGRSLDVLPRNGEFDISELVLKDLRQSIREKLLDDDMAPLSDAVRSSREVFLRQQRLAKRAGPNFGRLKNEFIVQFIKSTVAMWQAEGELPPFEIDGKNITLRYTSPMAKQQNDEDLANMDSFLARMAQFQPGMQLISVKPTEYRDFVAQKSGIPASLLTSAEDMTKAQQGIGQAMAQGGPVGEQMVKQLGAQ